MSIGSSIPDTIRRKVLKDVVLDRERDHAIEETSSLGRGVKISRKHRPEEMQRT
jgi:hypothetical protein